MLHLYRLHRQVLRPLIPYVRRQFLGWYIMQFLVVNEYFGRKAFQDPLVSNRVVRCQPLFRVPLQASFDKIDKTGVLALQHIFHHLRARLPNLVLRVWHQDGHVVFLEEFRFPL